MSSSVPRVKLVLPVLLEPVVGCTELQVQGRDIVEALEDSFAQVPVLRHHLMQTSGELRPHILCLHNSVNVARSELASTTLAEGDEIRIHQAISGG